MQKFYFLMVILLSQFLACPSVYSNRLPIEIFKPVRIGGIDQWVLIRGTNPRNPVLLYLHGGPGQSLVPYAHFAAKDLISNYTVVYWDQRGAGLTFRPDIPESTLSFKQYIQDTVELTAYLTNQFKKDKITLLGHSWGTVLGLLTVKEHPDLYDCYIGVGQLIDYREQERLSRKWLISEMSARGVQNPQSKVGTGGLTPRNLLFDYGGIVHLLSRQDIVKIKQESPYSPEKYTDALDSQGLHFCGFGLYSELAAVNFRKQIKEIKIPVVFFLGRYDHITPPELVLEYIKILKAPSVKLVWFENSGHRMDIEESRKFQDEISLLRKTMINIH